MQLSRLLSYIYDQSCGGAWPAISHLVMSAPSLCLEPQRLPAPFPGASSRSELLREARQGDRESLAKLIVPYSAGLYRSALRLTRNPADAEDARQDAFLR